MSETRIEGQPSNPPRRAGDGNVPIAVGVVKGRVHMEFPPGQDWAAMDPENCRVIAEGLARAAYEASYGIKPPDSISQLADEKRLRIVNRLALVIGSMGSDGRSNADIANTVLDVVMREMT